MMLTTLSSDDLYKQYEPSSQPDDFYCHLSNDNTVTRLTWHSIDIMLQKGTTICDPMFVVRWCEN